MINWKMIRKTYESTPGMTLKALANRYHVKYGTICSHKFKYNWKSNIVSGQSMARDLDKSGLTPRQKRFCAYYLKTYNAYQSYHRAYNCKWSTARVNADRLLRSKRVQSELSKLHKQQATKLHIDKSDVLRKMVETYFSADPNKLVDYGNHRVTSKNGRKYRKNYVYFKNDHGKPSGIQEIGLNRNGAPDVKLQNMEKLGEFLYQVLPNPAPSGHGVPDTLLEAIKGSAKIMDQHDKLMKDNKSSHHDN